MQSKQNQENNLHNDHNHKYKHSPEKLQESEQWGVGDVCLLPMWKEGMDEMGRMSHILRHDPRTDLSCLTVLLGYKGGF